MAQLSPISLQRSMTGQGVSGGLPARQCAAASLPPTKGRRSANVNGGNWGSKGCCRHRSAICRSRWPVLSWLLSSAGRYRQVPVSARDAGTFRGALYAILQQHLEEMMPIVYTPTVGKAVQHYSDLYQAPRGITVSTKNIDHIDQILADYPLLDVRMIVATDSSAILGIGDQGHGGLAICIGKLALYTAGAGSARFIPCRSISMSAPTVWSCSKIRTTWGHEPRLRGDAYLELLDRFVDAVNGAGRRRLSSGKISPRTSRSRCSNAIATGSRRSTTISRVPAR